MADRETAAVLIAPPTAAPSAAAPPAAAPPAAPSAAAALPLEPLAILLAGTVDTVTISPAAQSRQWLGGIMAAIRSLTEALQDVQRAAPSSAGLARRVDSLAQAARDVGVGFATAAVPPAGPGASLGASAGASLGASLGTGLGVSPGTSQSAGLGTGLGASATAPAQSANPAFKASDRESGNPPPPSAATVSAAFLDDAGAASPIPSHGAAGSDVPKPAVPRQDTAWPDAPWPARLATPPGGAPGWPAEQPGRPATPRIPGGRPPHAPEAPTETPARVAAGGAALALLALASEAVGAAGRQASTPSEPGTLGGSAPARQDAAALAPALVQAQAAILWATWQVAGFAPPPPVAGGASPQARTPRVGVTLAASHAAGHAVRAMLRESRALRVTLMVLAGVAAGIAMTIDFSAARLVCAVALGLAAILGVARHLRGRSRLRLSVDPGARVQH